MRSQVCHLLADAARRWPDSPALTLKGSTVSYADLWLQVRRAAAMFSDRGLRRGDRVGVFLDKRFETVSAIFGVSAAAGVFVPINPVLRQKQVSYILDDCSCRMLVTTRERYLVLREELANCPSVEVVIVVGGSKEEFKGDRGIYSWDDCLRISSIPASPAASGIDLDMAGIFYTSGSTGKPKGVMVSHRNLIIGAESVCSYLDNRQDDVILSVLPLSFDAGFSQLTTAFNAGAHVVLLNFLVVDDVIRLCAQHKITGITAVPPLWIQLAARSWPPEATHQLRYFANTGGKMPRSTLDALRSIFPVAKPYLMYGLTEAFRSTYLDPEEVDRRPDSIGKAIPNAEILVLRPDGSSCNAGEQGELVHRGGLVALGYWNDREKTNYRFRNLPAAEGCCIPEVAVWSGDIVTRDDEGFLYFVGRNDEMIKTSGYRVSPSEIEEVAYDTGIIRDAVALGIEDSTLGQAIVLIVSPIDGAQIDIDVLLSEYRKALPLFMVPHQVLVREVLPRSPNGKFDRNLLKNELRS